MVPFERLMVLEDVEKDCLCKSIFIHIVKAGPEGELFVVNFLNYGFPVEGVSDEAGAGGL